MGNSPSAPSGDRYLERALDAAAKDGLPSVASNSDPPIGYRAKIGSGPCRCRGNGLGLDACGHLCCDQSPFTSTNPRDSLHYTRGGQGTIDNLCWDRPWTKNHAECCIHSNTLAQCHSLNVDLGSTECSDAISNHCRQSFANLRSPECRVYRENMEHGYPETDWDTKGKMCWQDGTARGPLGLEQNCGRCIFGYESVAMHELHNGLCCDKESASMCCSSLYPANCDIGRPRKCLMPPIVRVDSMTVDDVERLRRTDCDFQRKEGEEGGGQ